MPPPGTRRQRICDLALPSSISLPVRSYGRDTLREDLLHEGSIEFVGTNTLGGSRGSGPGKLGGADAWAGRRLECLCAAHAARPREVLSSLPLRKAAIHASWSSMDGKNPMGLRSKQCLWPCAAACGSRCPCVPAVVAPPAAEKKWTRLVTSACGSGGRGSGWARGPPTVAGARRRDLVVDGATPLRGGLVFRLHTRVAADTPRSPAALYCCTRWSRLAGRRAPIESRLYAELNGGP